MWNTVATSADGPRSPARAPRGRPGRPTYVSLPAHARASSDELQVSVVCLHDLFAVLREHGECPEELLTAEGLLPISLSDARSLVPVRCYERLVDAAFACASSPSLGLEVASDASRGLYPLLAHFATAVPTLRAAIDMLIRYNELFVDGVRFTLSESGGAAYLGFASHPGLASSALRFSSEMLTTLFVRLVRQVYATDARLHELRFRHARPSYADRYVQLFGCPVRFSESACTIVFSAEVLDRPQPCADAFVADLLREACERMLVTDAPRATVAGRVRLLLRRQEDLCRVDQDALARELGMGLRMLRRRLLREGANMSTLIDEARLDAARVELLRHGGTIKEAAERLGYSEISAFHRAFKRWTGKTPAEYVRDERLRAAGRE